MRLSNYTDFARLAYRDPVVGGDYSYLTGATLASIEYSNGFSISSGFIPNTEPAELTFSIKKHFGVANTEWDDFVSVADIGYEIWFQVLITSGMVSDGSFDSQYFGDYSARFLIKSIEVVPDYRGNLEYRVTCEDLISRAMNVPLTITGYPLNVAIGAYERFIRLMEHIDTYYDGIFPEFSAPYFISFDSVITDQYTIFVPPVTGGAYAAEPASGVLNELLNTDLAFIVFNSAGYEYRGIPFYTPLDPGIYLPPNDPSMGMQPLNTPVDTTNPGSDHYAFTISDITFANDNEEVIPCLRVELSSDATNHFSWQDSAAILKYGAKYVKQTINARPLSYRDATAYNSVDVYGQSIQSPANTERVTNVRFNAISKYTGQLKDLSSYYPGALIPIWYLTDDFEHADWYFINKVSHNVTPNSWEVSLDLWKPTLTNGWLI